MVDSLFNFIGKIKEEIFDVNIEGLTEFQQAMQGESSATQLEGGIPKIRTICRKKWRQEVKGFVCSNSNRRGSYETYIQNVYMYTLKYYLRLNITYTDLLP